MIALPPPSDLKPGECASCKAQDPPKVGYCAPARCYCMHTDCPAYARTVAALGGVPEQVTPVPVSEAADRASFRRAESAKVRAGIHADLAARRKAKR